MKFLTILNCGWLICFGVLRGEENTKISNVVGGHIKGFFVDRFSENSGHKKELIEGKLYEVNADVALMVYWKIGGKLIDVEREAQGDRKKDIRKIIFEFSKYLLQMQKYETLNGGNRVYVVGAPAGNEHSALNLIKDGEYPQTLVLPDGGGAFFWQAYVDLKSGEVDIIFNDNF